MFSFGNKEAEYRVFLDAVRAEIRAGVEPLSKEIGGIKEAVERVEKAQSEMYTREVMDLKLKERDERLDALSKGHEDLQASIGAVHSRIGGFWKNTFITAGIVLGPLATVIGLWPHVTSLFGH